MAAVAEKQNKKELLRQGEQLSGTAWSSAVSICWKTYIMGDQEIHAVSGVDL